MPTRAFQQPAGPLGILQLIAGYGAANRETQIANAAQQSRQNEILGAGLGKGVSNLFAVPAEEITAQRASSRELQNRLAVQQQALRHALQIEQARTAGNAYEQEAKSFETRYGVSPNAFLDLARQGQGQTDLSSLNAGVQPQPPQQASGDFGMSMADTGESVPFPSAPSAPPQAPPQAPQPGVRLPLANPGMMQTYQNAKKEMFELVAAKAAAEGYDLPDPSSPMYQHSVDLLARKMVPINKRMIEIQQTLGRFQEPDNTPKFPGGPNGQMIAMNPGGNKDIEGGRWILDPDGKTHYYAPTKAEQVRPGFYIGEDGKKNPTEPNGHYPLPNGNWITTDKDGQPTRHEPKNDGEGGKASKQFHARYEKRRNDMAVEKQDGTKSKTYPNPEEVNATLVEEDRAAEDYEDINKYGETIGKRRSEIRDAMRALRNRYPNGIPVNQLETRKLWNDLKAEYVRWGE